MLLSDKYRRLLLDAVDHEQNLIRVDEFNFYRATHAKRIILSALPTVTPPAGFNLDRNNGCDFDIQMHGCLDRF